MAKEVTVNVSMSIQKRGSDTPQTPLIARNYSRGFQLDMAGAAGPSPGLVVAKPKGTGGTQVTFSNLTQPTACWIANLGRADGTAPTAADYITYGIYDPATRKFYPLGEVGPGEAYVLKLSRDIQETYLGPGTGTAGLGETARLMLLANLNNINAAVEAYEY